MVSISDVRYDGRAQRAAEALVTDNRRVDLIGFTRSGDSSWKDSSELMRYRLFRMRFEGMGRIGRMLDRALFTFWAVIRLLVSPWDIVHLHEPHFLPAARLRIKLRGGKIVYDVRELYQSRFGSDTLEGKIERKWQDRADAVVITSEERKEHFFKSFPLAERPVAVARNLPRKRPSSRRLADEAGAKKAARFVYHGRLSRANRHLEEMLLAFRDLNAWLHVMGADSQGTRAELEEIVRKERMGNVSFHEPCAPEELIAICDGIDAGLMPYREVDDNTSLANPTKMAEYAGAGMALIASDFPLMRQAIAEHGVGLITTFDDPDSLHRVLAGLIEDRERLEKMKHGAASWYASECDWGKESRAYPEIYSQLE